MEHSGVIVPFLLDRVLIYVTVWANAVCNLHSGRK